MRVNEFVQCLGRTRRRWIQMGASLRTYNRKEFCFCPLTAVCYMVTGRKYNLGKYDIAAKAMGMGSRTRDAIQRAADYHVGANRRLAKKLRKACKVA